MTADLPAFLRARYDEEAEAAEKAGRDAWHYDMFDRSGGVVFASGERPIVEFGFDPERMHAQDRAAADFHQAAHIARHDPARVLKEIEAKRRIIAAIFNYEAKIDGEWGCCHGAEAIEAGLCPETNPDEIEALRLLALPYDDHPDYREEFGP
ncbi:hypothetical protein DMA15_03630 [Streptomyces sp. WAC 01529]|uniref:DUF6221 family protein n=1 Tax=Streptomyces sp. WAC 01529 TaxID=2203205 RepID=UPI000F712D82|nr:DUF6221 family protein [Streptomyces sp. WAC 01529]AZM51784.1 hypothetical protein DMA15_03630 [Streptomyces sp. WAC 01529]